MRRIPSPRIIRKLWRSLGNRLGNVFAIGALMAAGALVLLGFLFYVTEQSHNENVDSVAAAYRWLGLTLLTAGSPFDINTVAGNIIYFLVLIGGLGFAAMVTGAVASKLVEFLLRRSSGMGESKASNHVVICGWSSLGPEIIKELHADEVKDKRTIVVLAPLDSSPYQDPLVTFISGNPSDAGDLARSGIDRAETAIILSDASNASANADERDAKTLLTTLAVESIAPQCYTCVEVIRSENRLHFERTKADELVVSAELTGALLAGAAQLHGLTRAVTDLLTHPVGNEIYQVPAPADIHGLTYVEALGRLKGSHNCVLIGIAKGQHAFDLNPPADRPVRPEDRLLVIAQTGFGR